MFGDLSTTKEGSGLGGKMEQEVIAKGTVLPNDRYCYLETETGSLLLGGWAARYEGEQLTIVKEGKEPLPFMDFMGAELPALELV